MASVVLRRFPSPHGVLVGCCMAVVALSGCGYEVPTEPGSTPASLRFQDFTTKIKAEVGGILSEQLREVEGSDKVTYKVGVSDVTQDVETPESSALLTFRETLSVEPGLELHARWKCRYAFEDDKWVFRECDLEVENTTAEPISTSRFSSPDVIAKAKADYERAHAFFTKALGYHNNRDIVQEPILAVLKRSEQF